MIKRILWFVLCVLFLTGCEKLLFKKDLASSDPLDIFDYLWEQVDKKYSYFELKNIDWENIRVSYRAKLSENSDEEELFSALAGMLNELKDDHSNLISPFNISRYDLALQKKQNYYQRTVEQFYIPDARLTGPFFHDFLPGGEVAYIRYSSFLSTVSNDVLDHILVRYSDTKGIILDLRENQGGAISNIPLLLERFSGERTLVGYFITRNGPEHDDFGPMEPFYIGVHNGITYTKPLIVLIDRGSFSATTSFALATKAFPHITLIGDTTGGGGGLPNGGQLPNGWTYRFSVSQLLDLNGNNYAEAGVPPDITASFDWNDLTRDEIIEKALLELN